MKVLQIVPVLNYGGIESHRFLIAKYHDPKNFDLSFCCLSEPGMTGNKIEKLGYSVTYLHENVKIPNFRLILKLFRLFKQQKPDVVHTCAAEANFHGIIAAYLAGVPVRIAEEIGLPNQSSKAKMIFRFVYLLASAVIGVSQKVSDYLSGENKVPSKKIKTIYNPYDLEVYNGNESSDKKGREFTILSVGRLVEEKNHLFLIKSFEKVSKKYPNAQLKIVGDGPLRNKLEMYIMKNDLQNVQLLGFREDIPNILQNSDLFILPSKFEGLGIALIEAMAMGVPVIGTNVGGIPEVILKNQSMGWIVPSENIDLMSQTIEEVMHLSENEERTIVNNARESVQERFSPYTYMKELDDLYKGLM